MNKGILVLFLTVVLAAMVITLVTRPDPPVIQAVPRIASLPSQHAVPADIQPRDTPQHKAPVPVAPSGKMPEPAISPMKTSEPATPPAKTAQPAAQTVTSSEPAKPPASSASAPLPPSTAAPADNTPKTTSPAPPLRAIDPPLSTAPAPAKPAALPEPPAAPVAKKGKERKGEERLDLATAPKRVVDSKPEKVADAMPAKSATTAAVPEKKQAASGGPNVLKAISLRPSGQAMILRIEAERSFTVKNFVLPGPDRLVVDLAGAWNNMRTPAIPANKLVTGARLGQQQGAVRLVLDLSRTPRGSDVKQISPTLVEIRVQ